MQEKAILAIEEALLSSLFTMRGLVELLVTKEIINRKELEDAILRTETDSVGAGEKDSKLFLEKREKEERRIKKACAEKNKRCGKPRRH